MTTASSAQSDLRIVLIIEEGYLFTGYYLPQIMRMLSSNLIMVASFVPHKKMKRSMSGFETLRAIGPLECITMAAFLAASTLVRHLPTILTPTRWHSLRSLARHAGITHVTIDDLNSAESYEWLASLTPDVVISSVSQILKANILSVPKLGFLNKHASILPAYKGLSPIMHALAKGEPNIGMSVHIMSPGIDEGQILAQSSCPVMPGDTVMKASRRSYTTLPELLKTALDVLQNKVPAKLVTPTPQPSYYSTPVMADWMALKQKGHRLI